ncbi:MAG: SDR family oxidoreductase [Kiloniellales bacterium]|nr:SDR family oxidoreductase [Kiloniellales bacterium]
MRLKDKVAIITGASRGIGAAVALGFAREGAALALLGHHDQAALRAVEAHAAALGAATLADLVDVREAREVLRFVKTVEGKWGRIDILVNNAGIIRPSLFEEITETQWDETMAVHLKGTFHCTQAALPFMKRQKAGKIINVAAPSALRPSFGVSDYAAAKGGIIALTLNLSNELKPYNIQINCVSPVADTRMTEAIGDFRRRQGIENQGPSRPVRPEAVTPAFVFFACSDSDYITGQILAISR